MNEDFIPQEGRGFAVVREIYEWLESGLTAVLCVVLIFAFLGRMVGVVGESMLPTLEDRDRLIATPIYRELKPGDIVVITKPNRNKNEPLIKRVIAVGGQNIDIDRDTGVVSVEGRALEELYVAEMIHAGSTYEVPFPQTVPPGHIFVMGDNRNRSWDSRNPEVGMVDERYVLGKVVCRILPYERLGKPAYT